MPMPVSFTMNRSVALSSKTVMGSTMKVTFPPSGVNFTALPRMLMRTCLSFMSSPM